MDAIKARRLHRLLKEAVDRQQRSNNGRYFFLGGLVLYCQVSGRKVKFLSAVYRGLARSLEFPILTKENL